MSDDFRKMLQASPQAQALLAQATQSQQQTAPQAGLLGALEGRFVAPQPGANMQYYTGQQVPAYLQNIAGVGAPAASPAAAPATGQLAMLQRQLSALNEQINPRLTR